MRKTAFIALADPDCEEEGRFRTARRRCPDICLANQSDLLGIDQFPDGFSKVPGTMKEFTNKIHMPPGVVVRVPARPNPKSLKEVTEGKVQTNAETGGETAPGVAPQS